MTKRILFILLAVVLAVSISLIGCAGGQQEEEEEEEEPEVLEITLSDHNPPQAAPAPAIQAYGQYIQDHSDGLVTVDVHIGGELYSDVELFPAVKAAAVDGGTYVPEIGDGMYYIQVLTLPFMEYPGQEEEGEIFWELEADHPEIMEDFTSQGVILPAIIIMPEVNFHFYADGLVVDEPEDMDGMSMIALEGDICEQITYIPGVTSIHTDFPGLFGHMEAKTGDGYIQQNPFLRAVTGYDQLHSHTMFPGGIRMCPIGILWNLESYEACLDIVGQEVMDAAYEVYCDTFYPLDLDTQVDFDDAVADRGDTVTTLTEAQLAGFKDVMVPYIQKWIDEASDPAAAQALYDDALALIAAY